MFSYQKLWKELERQGKTKNDLRNLLSPATVSKLSKNDYISMESLEKICIYLNVEPGEIIELDTRKSLKDVIGQADKLADAFKTLIDSAGGIEALKGLPLEDEIKRMLNGESVSDILGLNDIDTNDD